MSADKLSSRAPKLRSLAVFLMLTLALAGCGQSEAEKATEDDQQCQSYGAKPGTDAYIQCRATLHFSRLQKEERETTSMLAAAAIATAANSGSSSGRRR